VGTVRSLGPITPACGRAELTRSGCGRSPQTCAPQRLSTLHVLGPLLPFDVPPENPGVGTTRPGLRGVRPTNDAFHVPNTTV